MATQRMQTCNLMTLKLKRNVVTFQRIRSTIGLTIRAMFLHYYCYQQIDLHLSMTSCYLYKQFEVGNPAKGTDLYVESLGLVTSTVPALLASKLISFEVRR